MLALFTDSGLGGPCAGQLRAVLARQAPQQEVVDLMHDAPPGNPRAAAYLLAALAPEFPPGSVFAAVVGTEASPHPRALVAELDGRWFVAPDNGLLSVLALRCHQARWWVLDWRAPEHPDSFTAPALFAPVAAMLATGREFACTPCPAPAIDPQAFPEQLAEVVYIDPQGNAVTGLQTTPLPATCVVRTHKKAFPPALTGASLQAGQAYWQASPYGLLTLSVQQGSAERYAKLVLGARVSLHQAATCTQPSPRASTTHSHGADPMSAAPTQTSKRYSLGEEIANSIVAGIGTAMSIAALVVLLVAAATQADVWAVVSVAIFGTTLILSHLASTLYHSIAPPRAKRVLQIIDHLAIYLLIAGTYTPFALVNLRGIWGWSLLVLIWLLALLGLLIKLTPLDKVRGLATGFYVAMGWLVVVAIKPLLEHVAAGGLWWLLAGGLCYTAGVGFYLWRQRKYSHAIWHVFVLAGSMCHFFAVLYYVIPYAVQVR